MGPDFLLGLVIFFGFLFIGRVFNMKAINSLTNEEKGKMITVLQGLQKFYLFPIIIIVITMYLVSKMEIISPQHLFIFYFIIIAIYLVGINVFVYKRLSGSNFKKDFNKNFIISKILNYIGSVSYTHLTLPTSDLV